MKTIVLLIISQYFLEPRLVRASEVSKHRARRSNSGELGNRAFRIHLSSAREPNRFVPMDRPAAQDFAGMHHARRFHRRRLRSVPRADPLELLRFLRAHHRSGLFRV